MAALSEIPGISGPVLALFEAAGLATVEDIGSCEVDEILAILRTTNEDQRIVPQLPEIETVKEWRQAAVALGDSAPAGPGGPAPAMAAGDEIGVARVVAARELKQAGIAVSAVPIAKLLDEEAGRPGGAPAHAPVPAAGRDPGPARAAREDRAEAVVPVQEMKFKALEEAPKMPDRQKRRNPGMSLHAPFTAWVAAGATLLAQLFFAFGVIGTIGALLMARYLQTSIPREAVVIPILLPVALLLYATLGTRARCRLCGQRVFVPKKCLKHVKADRSVFGYVFASAIRAFFTRSFRCMFCGTKIRLQKKVMPGMGD